MLSRTLCSISFFFAIGFLTASAKDLDFEDLTQETGNGLPQGDLTLGGLSLGGSQSNDGLEFDDGLLGGSPSNDGLEFDDGLLGGSQSNDDLAFGDGLQGDSSSGDFSFDDFSSSSSSSSSLDGLSEALGYDGDDLLFPDGTADRLDGGKGDTNLDFKDGYDDSLEPITSTIHTTTTICPVDKTHKPTGEVPLPGSDYQFPDGTDDNLQFPDGTDDNLLFPDGTDDNLQFPDGAGDNLQIPGGTDDNLQFPDGAGDNLQIPGGTEDNLQFPDGTNAQDSFPGSDLQFPDGQDTLGLQDSPVPFADTKPFNDVPQPVTVTVTQIASQPTGCAQQAAPPLDELGNVCKQMMAICAPYMGQGMGGLAF